MCVGVISYSYAISSLSSVLHSLDSQQAKLKEKLVTLDEYDVQYDLPTHLYMRLRQAIKYNSRQRINHNIEFMNNLPQKLQLELSSIVHEQIVRKVPFFQAQTPEFIAYIGPLLRPRRIPKDDYVFREGDSIDEMYFLLQGEVELVIHEHDDTPFVVIPAGYYFGELDLVHMLLQKDRDIGRQFTVKAKEECDMLVLSKTDLFKIMDKFEKEVNLLFLAGEKRLARTMSQKKRVINAILRRENQEHTDLEVKPRISITPSNTDSRAIMLNIQQINEEDIISGDHQSSFSSSHCSFTTSEESNSEGINKESHKEESSYIEGDIEELDSKNTSKIMKNSPSKRSGRGRKKNKKRKGGTDRDQCKLKNVLSTRFKKMNTMMRNIENKQVKLSGLLTKAGTRRGSTLRRQSAMPSPASSLRFAAAYTPDWGEDNNCEQKPTNTLSIIEDKSSRESSIITTPHTAVNIVENFTTPALSHNCTKDKNHASRKSDLEDNSIK